MPLFHRADSSHPDSHGRYHLTCAELAERYAYFHEQLSQSYFKSQANHKVCKDAMDLIRTTHISKKTTRFLKHFVALVRETYSHEHYNIMELLYEEKDVIRSKYWHEIQQLYEVIMKKADKVWPHPCVAKMEVLLQFAHLYSLYKDVATQEFIMSIYTLSADWMHHLSPKQSEADSEIMYEYFDQIQLTFRFRDERRGSSISMLTTTHAPREHRSNSRRNDLNIEGVKETSATEYKRQRLATKEELDEFFERIMDERMRDEKKERRGRGASTSSSASDIEFSSSRIKNIKHEQRGHAASAGELQSHYFPEHKKEEATETTEAIIEDVIRVLDQVSTERGLDPFDYRADFERRFQQKRDSVAVEVPVIVRANPNDKIDNYRRKALFNEVSDIRRNGSGNSVCETTEILPDEPRKSIILGEQRAPRIVVDDLTKNT